MYIYVYKHNYNSKSTLCVCIHMYIYIFYVHIILPDDFQAGRYKAPSMICAYHIAYHLNGCNLGCLFVIPCNAITFVLYIRIALSLVVFTVPCNTLRRYAEDRLSYTFLMNPDCRTSINTMYPTSNSCFYLTSTQRLVMLGHCNKVFLLCSPILLCCSWDMTRPRAKPEKEIAREGEEGG